MAVKRAIKPGVACALLMLGGCNAVLGIESEYFERPEGDGSVAQHIERTPGISRQSCAGGLLCGDMSCCEGGRMEGGSFTMGCTEPNPAQDCDYDEDSHQAYVSGFRLDAFEVTVGRFRKFADAFGEGWRPMEGAGSHPKIDGTGWKQAWEEKLPSNRQDLVEVLKCIPFKHTWSDTVAGNEQYPLNCVNWYEALAFCIWDGGRLPTEAEWEYAAKGGSEHRTFPWGSQAPDCTLLHMGDCEEAPDAGTETTPFVVVGSRKAGEAKWGQYDLAGSLWEWTFDTYDDTWYKGNGSKCNDCANIAQGPRADRGGSFYETDGDSFRGSYRGKDFPQNRNDWLGFRCARDDP